MNLIKFNPVLKVEENLLGTDYVVGDIHGMYSLLMQELNTLNFDKTKDRLFCVGDLIDRGKENEKVISLLKEDWFFSVRGNHEQMCIDTTYFSKQYPEVYRMHVANGGVWFCIKEFHEQEAISKIFLNLPFLIEVKVGKDKIGIIHADAGEDWSCTKRELSSVTNDQCGSNQTILRSLWSRTRITKKITTNVNNIDHVFLGHTPVNNVTTLGNCSFIDRGSCSHQMFFTIIDIKTYLKNLNESN